MPSSRSVVFVLFLLLLGSWLLFRQLSAPNVRDLAFIEEGTVSPRGDWILICGKLKSGGATRRGFLFRKSPRKLLFLGKEPEGGWFSDGFAFSSDGRQAAWVQLGRARLARAAYELFTVDLNDGEPRPSRLPVSFATPPRIALSPDGRRVAALESDILLVIDVVSRRTVASVRIPSARREPRCAVFLSNDLLRLYPLQRPPSGPLAFVHSIIELELTANRLSVTGSVQSDSPGMYLRPNARGDRLLALERGRSRITLRDGRTGELLATLRTGGKLRAAEFLSGGRLAVVLRDRDGALLRLYSESGEEITTVPLEISTGGVVLMGEPAPRRFLIGLNPTGPADVQRWSLLLLDLSTGSVISRTGGLAPLDPMEFWHAPTLPAPERFSGIPWRILLGHGGLLVDFNSLTGEQQVLIAAGEPALRDVSRTAP